MKRTLMNWRGMAAIGLLALVSSCQPDDDHSGDLTLNGELDPGFTIEQISANRFRLVANDTGSDVTNKYWDAGSGYSAGGDEQEIFLPDAGTYTLGHTICGAGATCFTATQELVVATSDPIAGNIIVNGTFAGGQQDPWQILNISASGAEWTFSDGWANVSAGGWQQKAIYQAVQVEGGHTYKIDMKVKSDGLVNTWFELYADYAVPTQGSDYSSGGRMLQINTWGGCGTSAFEQQLSSFFPCGDGVNGATKMFPTSGTVYVVIKCGGESMATTNVSLTNVEMRRID